MSNQLKKIILGALGIGTALAAGELFFGGDIPIELQLKVPKEKILFSQTAHECVEWNATSTMSAESICLKYEDIVSYLYYSDVEVPALAGEDIAKRTENAQFFKIGDSKDKKKEIWTAQFYTRAPFYQSTADNKWYQTETATTTLDAFNQQVGMNRFERLIKTSWAASTDTYAGAGDGAVNHSGDPLTWAQVHNDLTGNNVIQDSAVENYGVLVQHSGPAGGDVEYRNMWRTFFPFDTSMLPTDATVATATLRIWLKQVTDGDNDGYDYVGVVQTSQASTSSLAVADYDQCGATTTAAGEGALNIDITGISAVGTNYTYDLNATGTSWIKKSGQASVCGSGTGWTCLGLREGHDAANHQIADDSLNRVYVHYSGFADVTTDPLLTITYTISAGAVVLPKPQVQVIE
jgi:hypothetical protein